MRRRHEGLVARAERSGPISSGCAIFATVQKRSSALQASSRFALALATACTLPVAIISTASAAEGSGTVSGVVTIPCAGGFYGNVSFFRQDGDGDGVADAVVTTADGSHYVATLPIGSYKVGFSLESSDDFGAAYYDDVDQLDDAASIEVREGTVTGHIDAELGIDAAKGQIVGRITTTDGGLYTGDVEFYRVNGDFATSAGSAFAYLGQYDKVLAPGIYTFGIGLDPDDSYLSRYYQDSASVSDATTLEVAGGSVVVADMTALTDPGQGVIKGAVTTPSGPFTGDATFIWQGPDPSSHPTLRAYVGGGTYSRTLQAGTYLVGFSLGADHDGYLDQYFDNKPTSAGATLVTVGAGEEATGINGQLDADFGDGRVAGTVTLPDGSDYDGTVSFFRLDGDGDAVADFTGPVAAGEFDRAVPPGRYKVGFNVNGAGGYRPAYYDGVSTFGAATPVVVAAGATTTEIDALLVPTPSAPVRPQAPWGGPGNGSATVSWHAPASGGSPIRYYIVRSDLDGVEKAVPAAQTQTTITGLTNGSSYRFTVTAVNEIGHSPISPPSASIVPYRLVGPRSH